MFQPRLLEVEYKIARPGFGLARGALEEGGRYGTGGVGGEDGNGFARIERVRKDAETVESGVDIRHSRNEYEGRKCVTSGGDGRAEEEREERGKGEHGVQRKGGFLSIG